MKEDVATQRWRDGRTRFIPPDDLFDPSAHGVEEIRRTEAAALLRDHHYLTTCPVAVKAYGLFAKTGVGRSRLVGCAVFGMPASQATVTSRTGLSAESGLELTRFLALDECAFNAESFFMARAMAALREARPHCRAVIAHSDPTPRIDRDGSVTFRGHLGLIYQAGNAIYAGRARARILHLAADGSAVPDRLLSKIRRDGPGADGAERRLAALGAPDRPKHLDRRAWLACVLASGAFTRARHPGVHAYVLPVDRWARRALERRGAPPPTPRSLDLPMAA